MRNSKMKRGRAKKALDAAKIEAQQKEFVRKMKGKKFKESAWVDRNFPANTDELFVHKNKIEEVQSWLKATMRIVDELKKAKTISKICMLTGPSGAGKTATLFLVAKELGLEVKEFIVPMQLAEYNKDRLAKFDPEEYLGKNQFDNFTDFLFRAAQYSTLPIKGRAMLKNKVVVVEDFPNIFYRDSELFHNAILRRYSEMGIFPVVFIIPDSASNASNAFKLFPKSIIQELNIACISFNPVATTYMTKFMTSVCAKEGVLVDKSVKLLLESVAAASGGDIRCAINTLQFQLSQGSVATPNCKILSETRVVRDEKRKRQPIEIQKDETLFLFRALGKVLYSKRRELKSVDTQDIPETAVQMIRTNPLEDNAEELVGKIEVVADTFLNFLQQNYLPFFSSMDDIVLASSLMAESEFMLSRWPFDSNGTGTRSYKEFQIREEIALLVACRGLMYSNVHKTKNEWRPLKKPLSIDARTRIQSNIDNSRQSFPLEGPLNLSFFIDILPYYSKLLRRNPTKWMQDQKALITDVGTISKQNRTRYQQEQLLEKGVYDESNTESYESIKDDPNSTDIDVKYKCSSSVDVQIPKTHHEDEEYVIEDGSDND